MVGEVDNGGDYAFVWAENIWNTSVPFSQFYCGPKISLRKKSLKKSLTLKIS